MRADLPGSGNHDSKNVTFGPGKNRTLIPKITAGIKDIYAWGRFGDSARFSKMSLQFRQAVENMDVWSASGADVSFVITFESPDGPGFHGRRGFLASWRPIHSRTGAVKVIGSPFNTFTDAEGACNTMLGVLEKN